jgi:hypothetical protein
VESQGPPRKYFRVTADGKRALRAPSFEIRRKLLRFSRGAFADAADLRPPHTICSPLSGAGLNPTDCGAACMDRVPRILERLLCTRRFEMTKRWICLSILMVAAAWGADVTGNWTGTMVLTTGTRGAAYLKMKQNGTVITGTTGPSNETQFPITSGRIDGNQVTVEAKPGEPVLKLVLKTRWRHSLRRRL